MPYRPGRQLASVEDARAILSVHGEPVTRVERVAIGRGGPASAGAPTWWPPHDVPAFARSMMDGYAVRAADTAGATRERPVRLRLVETHLHRPRARRRRSSRAPAPASPPAPPCRRAPTPSSWSSTRASEGHGARCSSPRRRASTSGAPAATWWPAKWPSPRARCCRLPGLAWSRRSGSTRWTSSSDPGSRFSRPATRSSRLAARSGRRRSSTPTPLRWPRRDSTSRRRAGRRSARGRRSRGADAGVRRVPGPGHGAVLRRHVGRRARLPARDHRGGRDRALRGPAAQARQAHRVCDGGGPARLRHAGQPRVVPHQRLPAGGAAPAPHGAPAAGGRARRAGEAGAARSSRRPAGIRSIRSAWTAPRRCRCSRGRARSRAWRTPTDTSRYRRRSRGWKPGRWSK